MTVRAKPTRSEVLRDGARVVVVGGGPAGAFFAIHLLREAVRPGRRIEVIILERKHPLTPDGDPWLCRGCNCCAGGVSPRLHEILEEQGIGLPQEIIQDEIDYIWIQSLWKNFPLHVPQGMRMYSVFRGALPREIGGQTGGFDAFVLRKAVDAGARLYQGEALDLRYDVPGKVRVVYRQTASKTATHETKEILADFVTVAVGVNGPATNEHMKSPLTRSVLSMNPAFVPVETRRAFIFELDVGRAALKKHMNREIYFIEYGSRDLPLEHIALVPKGGYLTVVLVGKSIDRAAWPVDRKRIIARFLELPHIRRILPFLHSDHVPLVCACTPRMTVRPARKPYSDRLALIGDAAGARLYKDGLYSAHCTARDLAQTILHEGIDSKSLARGFGRSVRRMHSDNRCGRIVFALIRLAFGRPVLSRVLYQAFATEMKIRDKSKRPLGTILWKIASGTADYTEVFRGLFGWSIFRSIVFGGIRVTLQNIVTEILLGLKWGEYGRYPTVVLKEKRDAVKWSIAAPLGIALDESPDFERMYAIKIRAPAGEIFNELGRFGDESRRYLNLRWADVRGIAGKPNQVGSVIEYRLKGISLSVDLCLTRTIADKTLLYEVGETFAENGKLIFDIKPTKDGNHRLVIYTSFDFKRGDSAWRKPFWKVFRVLFPAYVHDVVWNHALCTIKEDVERRNGSGECKPSRSAANSSPRSSTGRPTTSLGS